MPARPLRPSSRNSVCRAACRRRRGGDRFELIGKNAMLSIFTRANPQPIREPGDIVKILKLAA